jgi:LacI family transcriptional regulator
MATIDDVAQLAGVSAGTVSNVLNRPSYVKPETRARVLKAIEELEFVPAAYARRYRPGRERVLGLAIVDFRLPYFVDVALGAETEAKAQGIGVVMCNNGDDVEREQQNLDLLIQLRVQGIIVTPVSINTPHLSVLRDRGIPIVYLDRIDPKEPCSSVSVDHVEGGRIAARHLTSLGHRRLVFVGDPEFTHLFRDRLVGFREGAAKAGLPEDAVEVLATPDWTTQDGSDAAAAFLARSAGDRATGVFCGTDFLAKGFIQASQAGGLSIPGDLSVVGFDDMDWTAEFAVPLTTVRQPRPELGANAVRLLQRIIDQPGRPIEHIVLEPELVVRESTASPRVALAG